MTQRLFTAPEYAFDEVADLHRADEVHELTSDLAYKRLAIVNVTFIGAPGAGDRNWVLVDSGFFGSVSFIRSAAGKRFGAGARPAAIILTHAHFDHVGALETLAEEWDAPVYAHELECPYLTGRASHPPADPSVGGGTMARLSRLYPRSSVDVGSRLQSLAKNGSLPALPDWRWIHTPGHSPGHVSLWRDRDRFIIVGDAFITTGQESAYSVGMQAPELHGPPKYFTIDWIAARNSVQALAELDPAACVTGHGPALKGAYLQFSLRELAKRFDEVTRPRDGVYVKRPASAKDGSAYR